MADGLHQRGVRAKAGLATMICAVAAALAAPQMASAHVLLACDNNFPNRGRNPDLADDNEFIVVKAPGLGARHGSNRD